MMFTTIPLPSLYRSKHVCVSCDKWIRFDLFGEFNVNDVYDYKCNTCVSDRDYNMSDRYNLTHPIREYMGEIIVNCIKTITTTKGRKVACA